MKSYWRKLNLAAIIVFTLVAIAGISYYSGLTGLAGASVCGDSICSPDENYDACSADCGQITRLFVIPTFVWIVIGVLVVTVIIEAGFLVTRVPSPEERMSEYMTRKVGEGHPHSSIQARLIRKGWQHEQVHEEFEEFRQQKLIEYIDSQLEREVPKDKIRKALLDVGWKLNDVNKAFGIATGKHCNK